MIPDDPPSDRYDVQPPGQLATHLAEKFSANELLTRHFPDPPLKVASVGKSEAERADELKGRAGKLLIELCALMDEGMRDGLAIRWANIAMNAWGRHEVVDLHVQKRF